MRVGLVLATCAVLVVVGLGGDYAVHVATRICAFGTAAIALDLSVGWLGRISLGHAAFLGLGAFGYAISARAGLPAPLALIAAVGLAGLAGLLLGIPALRLSGPSFAAASLAFGVAVEQLLLRSPLTGGRVGLPTSDLAPWLRGRVGLVMCFSALAVALRLSKRLLQARPGHVLRAVRDEPTAAMALGIDVRRARLGAFALSGGLAGLAGVLCIGLTDSLHGSQFNTSTSLELLVMVVVGGAGSITGAALGAALVVTLGAALGGLGGAQAAVFGAFLLVAALLRPQGLVRGNANA